MPTNVKPFSIDLCKFDKSSKSFDAPLHFHDTAEIMLACEGQSVSICEGVAVNLKAPYLIIYPAGAMHEQLNVNSTAYTRYCFSIDRSYIGGEVAPFPHGYFAFELMPEEIARLNEYARLLLRYFGTVKQTNNNTLKEYSGEYSTLSSEDLSENRREALDEIRKKHLLTLFLYELEPIIARHSTTPAVPRRLSYISAVCCYIGENFERKLTIDSVAAEFYISRTKLTSDFRSVMRMSFIDYLTIVRCSNAKKLLIGTNEPLSEIAEKCGFCSASHLISAFKRMNGFSPSEYRRTGGFDG